MTSPLDGISMPLLYILTVVFLLLALEIGYQIGKHWKRRSPDTSEGAIGAVAGVTLGLLAFLLAFIVGVAATRFDNRRALVMADANVIRTANLRADLLGEPATSAVNGLLTEYVDVRLAASETGDVATAVARSGEILDELWDIAAVGGADGGTESASLFIQSVNDVINVNAERVFSVTQTRLPFPLVGGIYLIAFLSLMLEGSHSRFQGTRNLVSMVILIAVLSIVILLIVDLDRPQEGLLQISQQPMIDLQAQLHSTDS